MAVDKIVVLNTPVLQSVRDRLKEIQMEIRAPNVSLTIQRVVSDWHPTGATQSES